MKQLSLRLILDSLNSTVEKHLNAFANKTLLHHLSRIRIFFVEQMSFVMQQENLGTQPAEGLGQFAANRATADHRQPARLVGQVENSFVCEKARLDQAIHRWDRRASARCNHSFSEAQPLSFHFDRFRIGESRLSKKNVHAKTLKALGRIMMTDPGPQPAQTFHHRRKVNRDSAGCMNPELRGFSEFGGS